MTARVLVTMQEDGQFRIRTEIGFPIGSRMLTVAPEEDKDFPELQDTFKTRLEADRAALRWNLYLRWAKKKKAKNKNRGNSE